MLHKAWSRIEEVPYCFSRSYVKYQGHTTKKNRWFWPKFAVSGPYLQFEFTNGYEMMYKAWRSIEEVPYCFSRSYVKLQGHKALKIVDFDPNWAFPDCISSLKSLMATKFCTKLEVALKRCLVYFKVIHQISRSHGSINVQFDPNWAFPDCNSSFNSPMATKWYIKLEVA